ncbi:MAG: M20 family metallopeptidase [Chitinispirillaceae bacterium]
MKRSLSVLDTINPERLRRLLIDAVNQYSPSYAEAPATKVFALALKKAGIPTTLQRVTSEHNLSERANIIASIGPPPTELLLVGHVDTIDLWHSGTHKARVEGDRLSGLGSADMKSGCAAIVEALCAVSESGLPLCKGVSIALVVGEEEYGDGSEALLKKIESPITIIGEPTRLTPCISHSGYLEARLVSKGQRVHAALPENGCNAIDAMLRWVLHISQMCAEHSSTGETIAVNPREIRGGEAGFVVAEHCEAFIDFHLPPTVSYDQIQTIIVEARKNVLAEYCEASLEYEKYYWSPGFQRYENDACFSKLKKAFNRAGFSWQPSVFRSHSDAGLFHRNGSLTVVCGPGDLAAAHSRDEWVSLEEVERAAHIYTAIILDLCGTKTVIG